MDLGLSATSSRPFFYGGEFTFRHVQHYVLFRSLSAKRETARTKNHPKCVPGSSQISQETIPRWHSPPGRLFTRETLPKGRNRHFDPNTKCFPWEVVYCTILEEKEVKGESRRARAFACVRSLSPTTRSINKQSTPAARTTQVYRKALKLSVNKGAVHQFSLLAHTVPVSVELDQDEIALEVRVFTPSAPLCVHNRKAKMNRRERDKRSLHSCVRNSKI